MAENSANNIPFIVGLATAGMLLLALSVVFFVVFYQKKLLSQELNLQKLESAYQKRLLEASITSQENERKRIASDLHDEVGSMLSAAKLSLNQWIRHLSPEDERDSYTFAHDTKNIIDEAIGSVRRISKDLLPSTLTQFGLTEAIKELCYKLDKRGVNIAFHSGNTSISLSDDVKLALYRITQELLNNAIKHANADHIKVRIKEQENSGLELTVEDDGDGFDYEEIKNSNIPGKGMGLFNLESRSNLIGAKLSFGQGISGKGTVAKISMKGAELKQK